MPQASGLCELGKQGARDHRPDGRGAAARRSEKVASNDRTWSAPRQLETGQLPYQKSIGRLEGARA
jgi:hypothetical protein